MTPGQNGPKAGKLREEWCREELKANNDFFKKIQFYRKKRKKNNFETWMQCQSILEVRKVKLWKENMYHLEKKK